MLQCAPYRGKKEPHALPRLLKTPVRWSCPFDTSPVIRAARVGTVEMGYWMGSSATPRWLFSTSGSGSGADQMVDRESKQARPKAPNHIRQFIRTERRRRSAAACHAEEGDQPAKPSHVSAPGQSHPGPGDLGFGSLASPSAIEHRPSHLGRRQHARREW